jgi:hypothetical protein
MVKRVRGAELFGWVVVRHQDGIGLDTSRVRVKWWEATRTKESRKKTCDVCRRIVREEIWSKRVGA